MVSGDTLLSVFVHVPVRNKPKRSKSSDLLSNDDCYDTISPSSRHEVISSSNSRTTVQIRIDTRIKVVLLCCFICTLPLIRNQWILDESYTRSTSTTSKISQEIMEKDVAPMRGLETNHDKTTMQSPFNPTKLSPTDSSIQTKGISDDNTSTSASSSSSLEGTLSDEKNTNTNDRNRKTSDSDITTQNHQREGRTSADEITNSSLSSAVVGRGGITANTSEPNTSIIVVQWNHWTDLERIVASIWGGNLFCTTINTMVQQYYMNHTTLINVAMNRTNSTTNVTEIVMVPQNVTPPNLPIPTIHFGIELNCYDLFIHSTDGTGNYIEAIYMMRLSLKYISTANIKLNITCIDNTIEFQSNYVLPWFTGVWYSPQYAENTTSIDNKNELLQLQGRPYDKLSLQQQIKQQEELPVLTSHQYCGTFSTMPTAILFREMQYEVRRMAIALSCNTRVIQQSKSLVDYPHRGKVLKFLQRRIYYTKNGNPMKVNENDSPRKTLTTHIYADNQQERIPSQMHLLPLLTTPQRDGTSTSTSNTIDFDDVVIHFRCGDLLSTTLSSYGFLTFRGYSRHINVKTTKSIGILTQPFGSNTSVSNTASTTPLAIEKKQTRTLDSGSVQQVKRCRTLVYAFVDYLQEQFPNTTISIRNDKSETIALAYTRMVLAKQVIGSMSTFSVFPILSSFGNGYYLRPRVYDPSMWLINEIYPITKESNIGNFQLFDDTNVMVGSQTKDLWDQYGDDVVLQWFRTGNYTTTTLNNTNETTTTI